MSDSALSPQLVAQFLQQNPEFFVEHAGVFAELTVPHPYQSRTISLGERQILTLRARSRDLEWQLRSLIQNATGNERTTQRLSAWCASLLAEKDAQRLPEIIVDGLARLFDLPLPVLRLWDLPNLAVEHPCAATLAPELRDALTQLQEPYCGPAKGQAGAELLDDTAASLTLLPLFSGTTQRLIGVLVLGSPDPDRFSAELGTEFLKTIATLTSAALNRLDDD